MHRLPIFSLALAALLLQACASAPKDRAVGIASTQTLETIRDDSYAKAERYLDVEAVRLAARVGLPRVALADGALGEGISAAQGALVANQAARQVCTNLAPFLRFDEAAAELAIELQVTAIRPTSSGASGVSAVLGVFVPGPFRLPAGLGGFAADGVARRGGEDVLVLRWAEGASALGDDAKISSIGDAYQLASQFADDFTGNLIDPKGKDGERRLRLESALVAANRTLCEARFGKANIAGRGVSLLLPLSPEAIDSGAPDSAANGADVDAEQAVEPAKTEEPSE